MKTDIIDPIRTLSSRACISAKPLAAKVHCTPHLGSGKRSFCMLCVHCPKCENDPQNSVCELCAACRQCSATLHGSSGEASQSDLLASSGSCVR